MQSGVVPDGVGPGAGTAVGMGAVELSSVTLEVQSAIMYEPVVKEKHTSICTLAEHSSIDLESNYRRPAYGSMDL